VTDAPHETQAGCIEALNAEIVRMRALLDQVRSATVPGPELPDEGDPEDNQEPV
jgi:hypothetical protein